MFYGFYVFTLSLVKGFVLINNFKRLKKEDIMLMQEKERVTEEKQVFWPGDSGSDRYEKEEKERNDGEAKEQR